MGQVRWSEEAVQWLQEIHRFIAADNPEAADKVVRAIHERVDTLATFPRSGHIWRTCSEGEIRILLYGHYRIAYLVRSEERLEVLGVFHGALDIDSRLP